MGRLAALVRSHGAGTTSEARGLRHDGARSGWAQRLKRVFAIEGAHRIEKCEKCGEPTERRPARRRSAEFTNTATYCSDCNQSASAKRPQCQDILRGIIKEFVDRSHDRWFILPILFA